MTMHPVAQVIVSDITQRRSVPLVYLFDSAGELIAWPPASQRAIPVDLQPLVAMYFAAPGATRPPLRELLEMREGRFSVQITPYSDGVEERYAVIIERFAVRARPSAEPGQLSPAP